MMQTEVYLEVSRRTTFWNTPVQVILEAFRISINPATLIRFFIWTVSWQNWQGTLLLGSVLVEAGNFALQACNVR